ncbi:MAG: ABC transporter permease subunit [Eubacterium sp.]|nr:ABC transporter permease subunit [Eubacterium sp.]
MNKLISAGFLRLRRDKIFWLLAAAMLVYAIAYMLNGCRTASSDKMKDYVYHLDQFYFHYALTIGLFSAVFTSLYLGTEYSDGAIRNRLIIGHSRTCIYLSSLAISISATLFIMTAWLAGALVGIPTLGFWHMGTYVYIYLLVSVLSAAALSAIFTLIGMLCPNKAMCAVAAIVLFLILMTIAFMLYNALSQPEFTDNIVLTADGMQFGDPVPNPSYVSGTKREVYQFMLDVLPTGQCIQIFDLSIAHPLRMIVSSISILAGVSLCGIGIFHKKNIR